MKRDGNVSDEWQNVEAHPNMWYAMTPSPASLTRTVRSIGKAEYSFAERFCCKHKQSYLKTPES